MTTSIFAQKKAKILSQLAVPDTEYSDLSPKGSVDAGIRDLIDEINSFEGLVTTSSCAGRVSVYLEGHKVHKKKGKGKKISRTTTKDENENENENGDEDQLAAERNPSSSSAGGKGGGEWLFVSHDPLPSSPSLLAPGEGGGQNNDAAEDGMTRSWSSVFGLENSKDEKPEDKPTETEEDRDGAHPPRLIHFKFEPMILHVLTASHELAQLVVQAGMEAGFRETGAVSLLPRHQSNEDKDNSPTPIVAVRSMGLSFESLIGVETSTGNRSSLVSPEYLELLVNISHERFAENQKRISRFREALKSAFAAHAGSGDGGKKKAVPEGWEDSETRKERKRLEGLRRREELRKKERQNQATTDQDASLDLGLF